ncbi:MAG: adenosine kinase [Hyphomicrobiales bacterium]|nr:MAG: adenosine kinase [Hyphomicrobiales bacterium]
MTEPRFDVLGIGNAIFDVLAHVEDDFLVQEKLVRGSMRLIDQEEAERLYGNMGPALRASGGCAGNTVSGVSSFGGRAAFIGKVAADELGAAYRHDMRGFGVSFDTASLEDGPATARSMILISPDGERTMNTFLGACQHLTADDIDPQVVAASAVTYLEGYLWDPPEAKIAFRRAAEIAHAAGRKVALTLSDSFCVDRFRDEFLSLVRGGMVDILFANEHEMHALYQTGDLTTAVEAVKAECPLTVVTLGAKGSLAVTAKESIHTAAVPVNRIVDLTGAGDLYAGGFLFGLARDFDLASCSELGSLAASEVISHMGARPESSLKELAAQNGFPL